MNSSTGILSEVGSNRITTGNGPTSVALTPNGQFAYVTNLTDQSISMFSVNATTGLLTSLGPAAAPQGQDPINVVVDPSGQLAYVSCLGAYAVTVFGINSNGTLTFQESVTTDEEPQAVVLVPR